VERDLYIKPVDLKEQQLGVAPPALRYTNALFEDTPVLLAYAELLKVLKCHGACRYNSG